jgi:hypothetical protein
MSTESVRYEPWPAWAKAMLIALVILAVVAVLPWVLMWTFMGMNMPTMAGACLAMMDRMREMMAPGMMR